MLTNKKMLTNFSLTNVNKCLQILANAKKCYQLETNVKNSN